VQTVQEIRDVQTEIRKALAIDMLRDVLQVMLPASDVGNDKDYAVPAAEVEAAIAARLRDATGVAFRVDRFRAAVLRRGGSGDEGMTTTTPPLLTLADVCTLARRLQDPDLPEGERIVTLQSGIGSQGSSTVHFKADQKGNGHNEEKPPHKSDAAVPLNRDEEQWEALE